MLAVRHDLLLTNLLTNFIRGVLPSETRIFRIRLSSRRATDQARPDARLTFVLRALKYPQVALRAAGFVFDRRTLAQASLLVCHEANRSARTLTMSAVI